MHFYYVYCQFVVILNANIEKTRRKKCRNQSYWRHMSMYIWYHCTDLFFPVVSLQFYMSFKKGQKYENCIRRTMLLIMLRKQPVLERDFFFSEQKCSHFIFCSFLLDDYFSIVMQLYKNNSISNRHPKKASLESL